MAVFSAATFLQSVPLATRILTALFLFFSILLAFLRLTQTEQGLHFIPFSGQDSALAFPWLVIVPGASWWYPSTLITASFCETSLLEFLVSLFSLPLAGRYLERQWGAIELLKFSAIVLVGSNIIAWVLAFITFAVFQKEVLIYGTQYHGLEALQVAFLVAFTQLIPQHQIQLLKGAIKLRVKDLPMLYVAFSNITCVFGYTSPFILIQFGWLISWAYLRFFKVNESGFRGDRSEAFAFVNWFPPIAHKPVQFISTTLFNLFVKIKVVKPWSSGDYVDLETASASVGGGGGGGGGNTAGAGHARAEAERRRTMALKALDQRLATSGSSHNRSSTTGSQRHHPNHNMQRSDSIRSNASSSTTKETITKNSQESVTLISDEKKAIPTVVFQAPMEDQDLFQDGGDIGQQGNSNVNGNSMLS